jgi:hypothetical protein
MKHPKEPSRLPIGVRSELAIRPFHQRSVDVPKDKKIRGSILVE